ncbi:MAG: bifunctional DNA-formamidopyrimidine glycosylase/DNA-(apurinic or apyrimidinic site) lyase [Desulfuromonadales bacterium]|nr:bifunctional DNA-formamidopyrimidine glycosylase/DNA-(apurinic or apyrimidinic site) lyase [Desulfuromonadales bacterium]
MPELPEVETTRRGIAPLVTGKTIARVVVRVPSLRWPVPADLARTLVGQTVLAVERRAKYLLLRCSGGHLIIHLGMTGHLRPVLAGAPARKHDHIDLEFTDGSCLRFHDPRRFGAFLWTPDDPHLHPLLVELGPEPFAVEMDGAYLHRRSRRRRAAVKPFIMDQSVVVGIGNIYASEALFRAGIHPGAEAGRLSLPRYERLAWAIREVLDQAIAAGGTTIRDFANTEGNPGYFALQLQVYGREGETCPHCDRPIKTERLGGRSTYYCSHCQKK